MSFTLHKSQLRTIRQNDPNFFIQDGFVRAPRAGFNISQGCPKEYRMIILECMNNGWLTPVAHITERELLFMGLVQCE
jgi:hypothetical protein